MLISKIPCRQVGKTTTTQVGMYAGKLVVSQERLEKGRQVSR